MTIISVRFGSSISNLFLYQICIIQRITFSLLLSTSAERPNLHSIFGASYLRLAIIDFISTCISCSPIGEIFRARLRQFPSLVNCCTIDWFSAWPKEALRSVASTFLGEIPELDESSAMEGLVCPDFYHMNYIFQVRIGLLQRDRT